MEIEILRNFRPVFSIIHTRDFNKLPEKGIEWEITSRTPSPPDLRAAFNLQI